jgi:cytochrome oxidase Cu insertion factor (SCO1/SenC/PrrC family)
VNPFGALGFSTQTKRGEALIAVIALAAGTGVGVVASLAMHRPAPAAPEVVISPSANVIGAPLTRQQTPALTGLTDQNGTPISLGDEKGHIVLVAFMDPLCITLCPVLGRDIAAVEQALPTGIRPVLLIVSDVTGRTAADVRQFVRINHLSKEWEPGWHWLIGPSAAALNLTYLAWGEPVEPPKTNYMDIIDPQGYLRVIYPAPLFVSDVVSAIKTIAGE